jgi:hypothetical protein
MDHIKDLFSRFKARPKPVALEKSPLSRLPKEVLLCIIDHLPASSAASFSVSCLQIQHRIGNRYIKNLSGSSLRSTEDTVEFLNLLKRDLPDQIACSACKKLHKIKHARRYMERRPHSRLRLHPCLFRDCEHRTALYLHGNFSSVVFKMAMKRYNQNNPEHTKLLNSWKESWRKEETSPGPPTSDNTKPKLELSMALYSFANKWLSTSDPGTLCRLGRPLLLDMPTPYLP